MNYSIINIKDMCQDSEHDIRTKKFSAQEKRFTKSDPDISSNKTKFWLGCMLDQSENCMGQHQKCLDVRLISYSEWFKLCIYNFETFIPILNWTKQYILNSWNQHNQ